MKEYTKWAFTLVELMVVVVIIGILSTIGFISYSNYLVGARDSARIAHLTKAVESFQSYATRKKLPEPENAVSILSGSIAYAQQWKLWDMVSESVDLWESLYDPKDKLPYTYLLANNKKHFQFLALMEDIQLQSASLSQANASYESRYPRTFGSELGVLTQSQTNIPLEDLNLTGSVLNIQNVGSLQLTSYLSVDEYVEWSSTDFSDLWALLEARGKGWRVQDNKFVCVDTNNDGRCGTTTWGTSEYTLPSNLADVFLTSQPFDDYWNSNTCSSTGITVVELTPWVDTIPATLNNYTVYKFSSWNYILNRNSVSSLSGKTCLGFIWNGNTNIYTTLGSGTWFYRLWWGNNIFYGINFYGDKDGNWWTHTPSTLFWSNPMSNFSYMNLKISWFTDWISANWNNILLKNIISFNNTWYGIAINWGISYLQNIRSYNNTWQGVNLVYADKSSLNNALVYNNWSFWIWIWQGNAINNVISNNNSWNGFKYYSASSSDSIIQNSIAFLNSWWFSLHGGILYNVASYWNGWAYTSSSTSTTYYGRQEAYSWATLIPYAPASFVAGTNWFLWFENGSQVLTGSYTTVNSVIPSVSWWNYMQQLKQSVIFDGMETYTFWSQIWNQKRPIRLNKDTRVLEYYGVDGVDYDSTKKIGQW